jgi:hypothetical protein
MESVVTSERAAALLRLRKRVEELEERARRSRFAVVSGDRTADAYWRGKSYAFGEVLKAIDELLE